MPKKKHLFKGKPYWAIKKCNEERDLHTEATVEPSADLGQLPQMRCSDEEIVVEDETCPASIVANASLHSIDTDIIQFAGLETGMGRSGITICSDIMQLHFTGHSNMWTKHTKNMLLVAKRYIRPILDAARERLRQMVLDENDIEYCRETSVEVGVSYDGTWSKRGFTANYGLGFIISVDSGQVLDFEFLSKVCPECDKNRDAGDEWMAEDKADCQRNHQGTSKSMEVVAAQNIWRRSSAYNMKYKWMICDGDSASYNCIWDTYGTCENCHHSMSQRKQSAHGKADRDSTESGMHDDRCCNRVIKLDCIGHIQK